MKKSEGKNEKTNVLRILDEKGIKYEYFVCEGNPLSAAELAEKLGQDCGCVFKTLVTVGKSGEHYVFMMPGNGELDLKKAAAVSGEKYIEMIPQKELLPLTGYIHGGCSPVGMKVKKPFKTFIDSSAEGHDEIFFSAGKIGHQVKMPLSELQKAVDVTPADLCRE